jgi:gliding motility-associated-like protein
MYRVLLRFSLYNMVYLMLSLSYGYGQNFVPNCEFELMNGCPTGQGQISLCKSWSAPGNGTTDYVHSCNNGNFSVPNNQWGSQDARSGYGYAHIISYYPSQGNYSEYLQCELACVLQAGKTYELSFFVSCSDRSHYAIDGIGAFLSENPLEQINNDLIDIGGQPYVSVPTGQVLDNKNGWTRIHGTYIAKGGEKYITIGNFLPNSQLTIQTFTSGNLSLASYYLEDVSLSGSMPLIDLGPDTTICPYSTITLDIHGSCELESVFWEDGSTNLTRTVGPGTYSVEGEIGCSSFYDEITIQAYPGPGNFLHPDTLVCDNSFLEIIPSGNYTDYLWQDGSDQPTYTTNTEGLFWLEVTDANTCSFRDSVLVSAVQAPSFSFGPDTIICHGTEVLLNPAVDSAFNHFLWSDNSHGLTLAVTDSGEYWLQVANPCGEMSDTIRISVYNCDPKIIAPNAFTPNGDGKNDQFQVKAENIFNFSLYVFDRWGTMLFESKDINNGWDGTFKGDACPAGAYVWLANYEIQIDEGRQRTETAKGMMVLLR